MVIENGDGTLTLRSRKGVFPSRVEHGGLTYVLQKANGDEAIYRPPWDPSNGGC